MQTDLTLQNTFDVLAESDEEILSSAEEVRRAPVYPVARVTAEDKSAMRTQRMPASQYKRITDQRTVVGQPFDTPTLRIVWSELARMTLYVSKHATQRVTEYNAKCARSGTYVELTHDEFNTLNDADRFVTWVEAVLRYGPEHFIVVELGLNAEGCVCKFSVCMRSPDHANTGEDTIETTTDRILFVCIGIDGGLKTFYVTPGFKEAQRRGNHQLPGFSRPRRGRQLCDYL